MKMIRGVFGAVSKKWIVEMLLVLSIGSTLYATPEEGKTLTLVSGGKAECVIITQASQNQGVGIYGERPLRAVIVDLQRILEKMTGAKVPIMTPKEAPAQGTKIYIGEVALPSGIVLDDKELDMRGYWIVAEPQILILRGKTEAGRLMPFMDSCKTSWACTGSFPPSYLRLFRRRIRCKLLSVVKFTIRHSRVVCSRLIRE